MITYYATLQTATDGNIVTYYDEDKEKVITEMMRYVKANGFTYRSPANGLRFTIHDYVLVEREPVHGAPVLSETSYHLLADHNNQRRNEA